MFSDAYTLDCSTFTAPLVIEKANPRIYEFSGHVTIDEHEGPRTYNLDSSNLLLRGCIIRNTERVVGVVRAL